MLISPPNLINAVKTCSKETKHSQKDQLQKVTNIRARQTEESEQTLEDEFKVLHLNLPVLKFLTYALMYNAILDKYVESLEQEVHIGRLKLLNDFYIINMKKDPKTPLLVGRGFLATANAVIDYRKAKIAVGEGITISEITRDAEVNPFNDFLVFRRMVELLGAIPINLKRNMWELEDLIENPINWDKPPKNEDGAWHAKIRLIDPDGDKFTKTLQSVPTSRKLSERESPKEIIDLDHFYDT
ncbi:hypothetical protein Tco_1285551 [Tanacetum coccineum]